MRIVISEFMSLDGVVQAPGGPQEDTDGGFEHGGWSMPYFDVDVGGGAAEDRRRRHPDGDGEAADEGGLGQVLAVEYLAGDAEQRSGVGRDDDGGHSGGFHGRGTGMGGFHPSRISRPRPGSWARSSAR